MSRKQSREIRAKRSDAEGFCELTFANAVRLHGRHKLDFFRGTCVERDAAAVLAER